MNHELVFSFHSVKMKSEDQLILDAANFWFFSFSRSHPTSCCSVAEIMSVLFFHTMKYRPEDPRHSSNDRFILSKVTHTQHSISLIWKLLDLCENSDCRVSVVTAGCSAPSGPRGSCAVRRVGGDRLPEGE